MNSFTEFNKSVVAMGDFVRVYNTTPVNMDTHILISYYLIFLMVLLVFYYLPHYKGSHTKAE